MTEYKCRLAITAQWIGNGRYATWERTISLPFVPFRGLIIEDVVGLDRQDEDAGFAVTSVRWLPRQGEFLLENDDPDGGIDSGFDPLVELGPDWTLSFGPPCDGGDEL